MLPHGHFLGTLEAVVLTNLFDARNTVLSLIGGICELLVANRYLNINIFIRTETHTYIIAQ